MSARRKAIERRILDAVRRMVALPCVPKAIYLNPADMADLVDTHPKLENPVRVGGLQVRAGKHSKVYSTRGRATSI